MVMYKGLFHVNTSELQTKFEHLSKLLDSVIRITLSFDVRDNDVVQGSGSDYK